MIGEKTAELKAIEETSARAAKRGGEITTRRYCFAQALTDQDTIDELEAAAAAADKKMDVEDKTAEDKAKDPASSTSLDDKALALLSYNSGRKTAGWKAILDMKIENLSSSCSSMRTPRAPRVRLSHRSPSLRTTTTRRTTTTVMMPRMMTTKPNSVGGTRAAIKRARAAFFV